MMMIFRGGVCLLIRVACHAFQVRANGACENFHKLRSSRFYKGFLSLKLMRTSRRRATHHTSVSARTRGSAAGRATDGLGVDFSVDPAIPPINFQNFRLEVSLGQRSARFDQFPHRLRSERESFDMLLDVFDMVCLTVRFGDGPVRGALCTFDLLLLKKVPDHGLKFDERRKLGNRRAKCRERREEGWME
jgi:hypothetical protein